MLRPARPEDADRIAGWLSDPAITRYLTSNLRGGTLTPQLVQVALRRRDQLWFVFEVDGKPAGLVAIDSIDTWDGVANLWFVLGESSLGGRGLTSAAIGEFCALNPAGLHIAMAWAGSPNVASLRCLARAGFHEVGRIPDSFVVPEGRFERVLFQRRFGG